ncbi:SMI1/KNR4 family protein [Mesonia aestuariivivens]|uniref:SMI1/KNR4 family protein n=1 Tax=Mesonia aestuariivivens TaxID=2796128 RepID=A0ABS6VYH7_9FLAO|nr:SMI1/KNR4 family protein [Mesonia aestuariivivens]MBW2960559.1 SMI1/KNR4 family protein [Mesonia aestuariivivens]
MKSTIAYKDELTQQQWSDFQFEPIQIETLPALEDPEDFRNSFTFRDSLLEAFAEISGKNVLKLLFITPDFNLNSAFYGIAYLEGKEIYTATIQQTEIFTNWYDAILDEDDDEKDAKLFHFSKNSYSYSPINAKKHEQIFEQTGEFIVSAIPNEFIAEKLAKEKADFITPFINLDVEYDFEIIKANFEKLVTENSWKVVAPTNNQKLYDEFEAEAGFAFPQLLKDFLSLHNGVEDTRFLNAESILKEWRDWQSIYNEWTQEELLDTYSTNEGKTLLMYTTPYWIPFFNLYNGNFIALDFAPAEKGTPGQVIRFGADQEIGYQEAESLSAFLEQLLNSEEFEEFDEDEY